jgi:hypothetical protein
MVTYQFKPNLPKAKIHSRINEWVAKSFVDANSVIKMNDKDEGKLIIKGRVTCSALDQLGSAMGLVPSLEFTMVSTSADNLSNITFEGLRGILPAHNSGETYMQKPSSRAETDAIVTTCMNFAPEIETALK